MNIFVKQDRTIGVRVQLFVAGKQGQYKNFFSVMKEVTYDTADTGRWKKQKGKNNFTLFECYLPLLDGQDLFQTIQGNKQLLFVHQEREITIEFGELMVRPSIFMPNIPHNSVDKGWWPGSLSEGFRLNMLFGNVDVELGIKAKQNAFRFIKEKAAVNLEFLHDFIGSVLYLHNVSQPISFQFNPDSMHLTFALHNGETAKKEKRVVFEAWEGDEALESEIFDMSANQTYTMWKLPFSPTKISYRLYQMQDKRWKLVKQHTSYLANNIQVNVNLTVGKLIVKKEEETEDHDITIRQRPIVLGSSFSKQPWLPLERGRVKTNKGVEIRQLGSLFLAYKGGVTHREIQQLIKEELFDKAEQQIWIWDPYLDHSVLDDLIILALSKRSLDIKLLLSEHKGERTTGDKIPEKKDSSQSQNELIASKSFPRCASIRDYLSEKIEETSTLKNFKIRNWYRAGKHTFHDRFIIIDNFVWSIGSSLKDIGNYHTTIYRLEGDLPDQVIDEFKKGWNGEFGHMDPNGLSVFPNWKDIKKGDNNE